MMSHLEGGGDGVWTKCDIEGFVVVWKVSRPLSTAFIFGKIFCPVINLRRFLPTSRKSFRIVWDSATQTRIKCKNAMYYNWIYWAQDLELIAEYSNEKNGQAIYVI